MAEPVFSTKTLTFLRALTRHNDREWFKAHKADYEAHVKAPLLDLVGRLEDDFRGFAPEYVSHPKVSLFRIYRDTRFSANKAPLKTNAAAHFPHRQLLKRSGGFYVEVSPTRVFMGGGVYMPEPSDLLRIREAIAADPARFTRIIRAKAFTAEVGGMQGAQLSRVPRGFRADHPAADLLRYKQFLAAREFPPEFAATPDFYPTLIRVFRASTPLLRFLNGAMLG